ncbi:MAG TPA: response regulator transcription factor [Actinomycetota bacterium]|nr:response regulator transcription factor [Actinomycetota bacterium]
MGVETTARVIVADGQSLVRQALRIALEAQPDLDVVGEAHSGCQAVAEASRAAADIALVSMELPRCDGIEVALRISQEVAHCQVLVIGQNGDPHHVLEALEAGASGYVSRDQPISELIEALRAVRRGETVLPQTMLGSVLRTLISRRREEREAAALLSTLSKREREVLTLLGGGLGHNEIARELYISPETARTHIKGILLKLGVHSRLEAAALARKSGLAHEAEGANA